MTDMTFRIAQVIDLICVRCRIELPKAEYLYRLPQEGQQHGISALRYDPQAS